MNDTDPVPRYEFENQMENALREIETVEQMKIKDHNEFKTDIRSINERLEKSYCTKDGVRDQFKIELSDYKMIKAILITIGTLVLGLIFAVVQQYLINQGAGR